jgi:hypothetical protein
MKPFIIVCRFVWAPFKLLITVASFLFILILGGSATVVQLWWRYALNTKDKKHEKQRR